MIYKGVFMNILKLSEFKVFSMVLFLSIISHFFKLPSETKLEGIPNQIYTGSIILFGLFTLIYALRVFETTPEEFMNKKLLKLMTLVTISLILLPNALKMALYYG